MVDRSVTVRLGVDNSAARRATAQSEQDFRRVAQAATASATEQQNAFQRAAGAEQASFERTAAVARASGRATQEAMAATTVSVGRLAAAAEQVPATFASAATISTRAMGEMATSAQATATTVAAAETRMSEATAASAAGIRGSLAMRLAAAEAVVVQEAAMASATTASAAASSQQAGAFTRAASSADRAEKVFGGVRTAGLLMLGMFAAAVVTAARFEKAMSGVAAVADATEQQMNQLREAALIAGRDTAFSASEAAQAEAELAKAGVSVDDILSGALKGSLSLAAAGQLDLAEAATISAQAMNTFKLKGADVSHIADVLAAGANKSAADVHGLGESLRMGGLLAQQTGLSLEDTVGVLSAFADRALIGSDAGTSLKTMLQRLVPQSDEARGIMNQLGFSAYDAAGNFVGLTKLAGNLKSSFSNLTPEARNAAMATIFGSDSVRAATILYELGADGVDRYRTAVNDQGAASRMAAVQMDNLSGDLEQLRGALEVALIQGGTAANEVLRDMVQWITRMVNAWSSLPGWLQTSSVALFGIGGALALLAGGLMLVLPKISAFKASLIDLSVTMPRVAGAVSRFTWLLGPWGAVLSLASAALAVFGLSSVSAKEEVQGLTEAVQADSNAIGANVRAWLAHKLETTGALKAAKDLGISTQDLTEAILGSADATTRVNGVLEGYLRQVEGVEGAALDGAHGEAEWIKSLNNVKGALSGLTPEISGSVEAAKREAEAAGGAANSTKNLGGAAKTTAADIADTRTAVEKLTDSLDTLNGKNISAAKAAIGMQSALADLKDKVKEGGTELDIHSEKGRANKAAILDAAAAAQAHAKAVMEQTGSSEQAIAVFGQDVEALKRVMTQAGFTQQQIESLTAAYAAVPPAVTTRVTDPGALQTIADLQEVKRKVEDVPPGKSITIKAPSAEAIQDLRAIGYTVDVLPGGKDVRVTVPSNDAINGTAKIQQAINGIQGRTVTVNVGYDREYADRHQPVGWANGGVNRFAGGGITAFAAGSERHVAQIAPPGAMRLWAEPETGGEAYIPLAAAKRNRSMRILSQVAGMFDQQLIPLRPTASELIPARSLAPPAAAGTGGGVHRTTHVTLYGARQSLGEQLADLQRHMEFVT
ncbi:phage tail tape measure protein [Kitasatospora sp. NPDC091335]|uniref:phage tail tape measure protein n=1 Tax=Kitasatospora sp. NPDC091335 TaxID=3364085 RepID=UPI0037FDEC86